MVFIRILRLVIVAALIGSNVLAQQGVPGCSTVEYGNRNQVDRQIAICSPHSYMNRFPPVASEWPNVLPLAPHRQANQ